MFIRIWEFKPIYVFRCLVRFKMLYLRLYGLRVPIALYFNLDWIALDIRIQQSRTSKFHFDFVLPCKFIFIFIYLVFGYRAINIYIYIYNPHVQVFVLVSISMPNQYKLSFGFDFCERYKSIYCGWLQFSFRLHL